MKRFLSEENKSLLTFVFCASLAFIGMKIIKDVQLENARNLQVRTK